MSQHFQYARTFNTVDNNKKANKKDSQLVIRINRKNRDTFVELCEELDTSAAREIRSFIQGFIKQHNT